MPCIRKERTDGLATKVFYLLCIDLEVTILISIVTGSGVCVLTSAPFPRLCLHYSLLTFAYILLCLHSLTFFFANIRLHSSSLTFFSALVSSEFSRANQSKIGELDERADSKQLAGGAEWRSDAGKGVRIG